MTDVTDSVDQKGLTPNAGKKMIYFEVEASADDVVDVADLDESLSSIDLVYQYDQSGHEQVATDINSDTEITLDDGGSTSSDVIAVLVVGEA